MQRYILIRVAQSVLAIFVVALVVFLLGRMTGNPADMLLPVEATTEDFKRIVAQWGLDKPLHVQFYVFISNAITGDFGTSLLFPGQPAKDIVIGRLPATIKLAAFALAIATVLALPFGVMAAVKKDTPFDSLGKMIALLGQSAPSFWVAIMLMWIFGVWLGWLPTSGAGSILHMILPGIAIGWFQVAAVMRLTRSSMLEVLDTEFIKLARIKGLSEWKVIWKHGLRNAAITPLTYYGIILGYFMTGSVVVETVFSWPGVGRLAVAAVRARDFPVVQTVVIVFAGVFIACNLFVDILYAYLDPRIRYERS